MLVIDKSLVANQSIFYAASAVVSCSCRCLWFVCFIFSLSKWSGWTQNAATKICSTENVLSSRRELNSRPSRRSDTLKMYDNVHKCNLTCTITSFFYHNGWFIGCDKPIIFQWSIMKSQLIPNTKYDVIPHGKELSPVTSLLQVLSA